jgi:hypothetical protein
MRSLYLHINYTSYPQGVLTEVWYAKYMKPKLAYAIVSKEKPSINLNLIFSKQQLEGLEVNKDEKIVQVIISLKK